MPKHLTVGATALFAGILCAAPFSLRVLPDETLSLSVNSATAEIGRPLTATSVAGVHRRHVRRAYRRSYYGYGGYDQPYRYGYGYGTYQPYSNYEYGSHRPLFGSGWFGSSQPWSGNVYKPSTGYGYYQQPYSGYGYRHWTQF